MKPALLSLLLATSLLTSPAAAQHQGHAPAAQAQVGAITITGAFARATLPRAPVGGAYLTITNTGAEDDRLLGATAKIGRNVELHEMAMEDGVMSMRLLRDGLVIPAGGSVTLDPSGMHLMINGLTERLEQGGTLPLVLRLERAGEVTVEFDILALNARVHPDWPEAETAHEAEEHHHSAHNHDSASFDQSAVEGDAARITGLLKDMFETEDSPLTVAPLLIEGDIAIIGWSQQDRGGRALLRRNEDGFWRVSICAGAALKGEANMIQMGIAPAIAARLAAAQAEAEAALVPQHAAQLDLFDQVLFFDTQAGDIGTDQH